MKTIWKIGLLTATGIGLGMLAKLRSSNSDCGCGDHKGEVKRTVGHAGEDCFLPGELTQMKSEIAPKLLRRREQFLKDLAKWGTKEGIIDVSDLLLDRRKLLTKLKAIQKGRIASVGESSHLKKLDRYIKDLEKWGTREGVIDVSNDEKAKKKKERLLSGISKQGRSVTQRFKKKAQTPRQSTKLHKAYEVTQVNIQNTSNKERTVSIWEANRSTPVSLPTPEDVQDLSVVNQTVVENTIHPQGMVFNPANQLIYIANQLTNNVSVVGPGGQLVRVIQLEPSNFPGFNSPVDLTVNTVAESPNFGKVYVVGSVSNTLSIIDLDFRVSESIPVGVRPLSVAFNPATEKVYVTNYVDHSLSIIDTQTLQQEVIDTGKNPLGVAVNPLTGDVYVVNSVDRSVSIIDQFNQLVFLIENAGTRPTHVVFHPKTEQIYVVSTGSDEVIPVNTLDFQVGRPIPVGKSPSRALYNESNDFIYVANREDNSVSVIDTEGQERATIPVKVNNGLALNVTGDLLFTSATGTGTISFVGFTGENSAVIIDGDYEEKRRDFQHNPALVKQVKFILSGEERFNVLKMRDGSATGTASIRSVSFGDYRSPQNFQNVSEVDAFEGAIIDGSNGWEFKIAPLQSITMMVYYHQFDMYTFLPEKARKSVGVEMGNGIPKSWKKAIRKEVQHG